MLFKQSTFTADFQLVDANTSFDTLKPHIEQAETQFILPVLGQALLTTLETALAGTPTTAQANLIAKCQAAIRELAMYIGAPKLNIRWSDLGAMKSESTDYTTASGGEVYFARLQYLIDGHKALDALINFIVENKADYSGWSSGAFYTAFKNLLVQTPAQFTALCGAPASYWLFSKLVPEMNTVKELLLQAAIGEAFLTEIITAHAGGSPDSNQQLLIAKLQKALALYTYSRALSDPTTRELIRLLSATTADELSKTANTPAQWQALALQKENEADEYTHRLKRWLNATASASVFNTYFSSDYYEAPATDLPLNPQYANTTATGTFNLM